MKPARVFQRNIFTLSSLCCVSFTDEFEHRCYFGISCWKMWTEFLHVRGSRPAWRCLTPFCFWISCRQLTFASEICSRSWTRTANRSNQPHDFERLIFCSAKIVWRLQWSCSVANSRCLHADAIDLESLFFVSAQPNVDLRGVQKILICNKGRSCQQQYLNSDRSKDSTARGWDNSRSLSTWSTFSAVSLYSEKQETPRRS